MLKTEIEFNLNWEAEVTLNERGALLWNRAYGSSHGYRDVGGVVKMQLHRLMELFASEFTQFNHIPISPVMRLYSEENVKPIRVEVSHFVEAMESKLKQNDDRDGWQDCSMEYLLGRLAGECVELNKAVDSGEGILEEAIDVANFAMMIADRAGALMK